MRFEVRFQCGRSLSSIVAKNQIVRIDRERVFEIVRREVTVSRPVWESHRLLDPADVRTDDRASFVDDFIKDRAGQSLAHVFTLLSLVLPATPLQIAYRGLHTERSGAPGHGARVPGRRAAAGYPRTAVAVSRHGARR